VARRGTLSIVAFATAFVLGLTPAFASLSQVTDLVTTPLTSSVPTVAAPAAAVPAAAADPAQHVRVFVRGRTLADARRAAVANGLLMLHSFDRSTTIAAIGTPAQIRAVSKARGVLGVEADAPWEAHLDTSNIATRGEIARTYFQPGFPDEIDGRGVTIAIIDGGVDGTHPFFRRPDGSSKVRRNMKGLCLDAVETIVDLLLGVEACRGVDGDGFVDVPTNDTDTLNLGGHGTHVSGIAAGVDVTLPDGKKIHGAAPGADLVALGVGSVGVTTYGSAMALDWVLDHHADPCGNHSCPPIRVVNLSLGPVGGGEYDPNTIVARIEDQLVAEGVTVVWAAGNGDAVPTALAVMGKRVSEIGEERAYARRPG